MKLAQMTATHQATNYDIALKKSRPSLMPCKFIFLLYPYSQLSNRRNIPSTNPFKIFCVTVFKKLDLKGDSKNPNYKMNNIVDKFAKAQRNTTKDRRKKIQGMRTQVMSQK